MRPLLVGALPARADCFQPRAVHGLAGSVVLTGAGGVGKTQLAAEIARRARDSETLDLLAWVDARTRDSIVAGYHRAWAAITGGDGGRADEAVQRLLDWLSGPERRWLIVLDDLVKPGDLTGLWPPAGPHGRTLLTTRLLDAAVGTHGSRRVPVGTFTSAGAVRYLCAKLAVDDDPAMAELVRELDQLPLALAQAAAYMADRGLTPAEYLTRFRDTWRTLDELTPEPHALPDDHTTPLSATWELSVAYADELHPRGVARPLLQVISMLDPHGIPDAVLTAQPVRELIKSARTAADLRDAVFALCRVSLAERDGDDRTRTHALLQRRTREGLDLDLRNRIVRAAARALTAVWPDVQHDAEFARVLRANAGTLTAHAGGELLRDGVDPLLWRAGDSLGQAGQAADAARFWRALSEAATGDRDRLAARHKAAYWTGQTGDAAGAVTDLTALLADYRATLGPDDPDTLRIQRDLADWRGTAGDPAGAAAALAGLLEPQTRLLGADHEDVLFLRHNLARWQGEAGDVGSAVEGFAAVLEARLALLGPDHPDTMAARGNLALWQGENGDVAAAAAGFAALYADQLRVLGPEHPHTLLTRGHLAWWRRPVRIDELAGLLADDLRLLGTDHPETLRTRSRLAGARGDRVALAAVLADQRRVLGPTHVDTRATEERLRRLS